MDNDGTGHEYDYQQYDKHIIRKETRYMERHIERWLIWRLQLPNKNRNTLRCSKPIQKLNEKQAKRSLFLTERPGHYTEEDNQGILVQNVFNAPLGGILLPWNPRLEDTLQEDSLFHDESCPKSRIINLLKSITFDFGMVMEDHGSTKGVILGIQHPTTAEPPQFYLVL